MLHCKTPKSGSHLFHLFFTSSHCLNKCDHNSESCRHKSHHADVVLCYRNSPQEWTSGPLHSTRSPAAASTTSPYCVAAVFGRSASLCIVDLCPILYIIRWRLIVLFCENHYDRWDRLQMQAPYQVTASGQKWIMWIQRGVGIIKAATERTPLSYIQSVRIHFIGWLL